MSISESARRRTVPLIEFCYPRWNIVLFLLLMLAVRTIGMNAHPQSQRWIDKPQHEWPQITMVNQIDYVGKKFPIAGCSFLLDTGVVPSRFVRCRTRKA